ncbi:BFH_collapsed_G0021210.mRNA.1.CDS.1 [Saccharomyces cerevisiae]|nr:BFH_collapsed_G0021210.mRNA.1.CDS.1 [Saccharomyces cerevisiae]
MTRWSPAFQLYLIYSSFSIITFKYLHVLKCTGLFDPNTTKTKLRAFVYNKVNETEAILCPNHRTCTSGVDFVLQAMVKKPCLHIYSHSKLEHMDINCEGIFNLFKM